MRAKLDLFESTSANLHDPTGDLFSSERTGRAAGPIGILREPSVAGVPGQPKLAASWIAGWRFAWSPAGFGATLTQSMEKVLMHHGAKALRRRSKPLAVGVCLCAIGLLPAGCKSIFDDENPQTRLRQHVDQAIEREIAGFDSDLAQRETTMGPTSGVEEALSDRRDELDALSPVPPAGAPKSDLGDDLTGQPQQLVAISLNDAVLTAVRHNLGVNFARIQPAISEEDVIAAQATFDAVLFGSGNFTFTDEPQAVPVLMGVPLGTPFSKSRRYVFETGIRKEFSQTGGTLQLSTDLTRYNNLSPGISFSPNPGYTSAVRLGLSQPLLRGIGAPQTRATIRLARNQQRRSVQDVRSELLTVIDDTENAYWDLVLAWKTLAIREWLVREGVQVRDVLKERFEVFDARLSEYSDAVAVVEQRKADVIRAQRLVRAASDRLKQLLNADDITVGSELLISPVDEASDAPVSYNLADAIRTALQRRPEIEQALLGIDDADVRTALAENLRLPRLDLTGEVSYIGLQRGVGDSYKEASEGSFIDYVLGLVFEYPLGNRAADASYRRARLERSGAMILYQRAVQNVVVDLKSALRNVLTNYELIRATRSFRVAQAENLRALLAQEDLLASQTPEFLNLKFQRQNTLALAQAQEFEALANYNKSLSQLRRAMGTSLDSSQIDVEVVDNPAGN